MKRKALLGTIALAGLAASALWLHHREPPNPSKVVRTSRRPPRHAHASIAKVAPAPEAASEARPDAGRPTRLLRVRVRTPDGPAVGATIFVDDQPDPIRTDAEGRWSKALPESPSGISARLGALSSPWIGMYRIPDDEIRIDLLDGVPISGHAVDADSGEPVAQAKVSVPGSRVMTDGSGAFALAAPPGSTTLVVEEAHHRTLRVELPVLPGQPQQLELRLVPTVALSGRVADTSGEPIEGATIEACAEHHRACKSALSAGDGGFELDDVIRGQLSLTASADGFAKYDQLVLAPASGLEVRMPRGAEVEGVVYDGQGAPAAGASVEAVMPTGFDSKSRVHATSDERGAFSMILAPGSYDLTASVPGACRTRPLHLELADETYQKVELHLPTDGRTAAGQVIDAETREPIAGAMVSTAFPGKNGVPWPDNVDTDAQGRFRVMNIPEGSKTLTASFDGYLDLELPVAPEMLFALRRDRTPKLGGRVLDEAGGLLFRFQLNGEDTWQAAGRFSAPVPDGGASARFGAEGYLERSIALPPPGADGDIDVGDVVLHPGQLVDVRVLDADGAPVPGASIFDVAPPYPKQRLSGGKEVAGFTGADGIARIHLLPGEACLVARAPDGVWGGVDGCPEQIAEGTRTLEVHLPRAGWIAGHVYRDGAPEAGVEIVAPDHDANALTDADGAYRLGPFHPGEVPIIALDGNSSLASLALKFHRVEVETGKTSTQDFGSPDLGQVQVAISAPPGVDRVMVLAFPAQATPGGGDVPDNGSIRTARMVEGHGEVVLDDVQPGAGRLLVQDEDKLLPKVVQPFEMPAGGRVQLAVTLTR